MRAILKDKKGFQQAKEIPYFMPQIKMIVPAKISVSMAPAGMAEVDVVTGSPSETEIVAFNFRNWIEGAQGEVGLWVED